MFAALVNVSYPSAQAKTNTQSNKQANTNKQETNKQQPNPMFAALGDGSYPNKQTISCEQNVHQPYKLTKTSKQASKQKKHVC